VWTTQVKIRGVRIEPGEVTAVLSQHPAIRECVVVGRQDEQDQPYLAAYVVTPSKHSVTGSELRVFLSERLSAAMVPTAYVFLKQLPLTANGKLDRRALPAPERRSAEIEKIFVAPRTPVEQTLAEIWSEILQVERVGIDDNFFDLGGHSLLATQVMSRVRTVFEIEIPLRSLFESPSVAGLAERIETLLWAAKQFQAPPAINTTDDHVEIEL
jgi:acyl carrier protein